MLVFRGEVSSYFQTLEQKTVCPCMYLHFFLHSAVIMFGESCFSISLSLLFKLSNLWAPYPVTFK